MQNIIERLKPNKSSDYFGFSAKHVKNGGFVSTHFLMQYMNTSFQYIEQGVPEGELVGCASLVHKGAKKPLSDPKSFRKITVCALLGQMKQMAVCDLALPILKPLKPSSQLGFTPGLFVKLANIMVSEKRALAISNNQIVLYQFLDATAAFDETIHPIILNQMYNGAIEDDVWKYFHLLHKNSSTYVKWNGLISKDVINEGKGNRQGGLASADEWKLYNNEMVSQLEQYASEPDTISGIATSCVAVADDVAPCATANHPRDAIHQMQILLNVVEDHGTQLHMKFGTDKCKLLISGRPTKTKALSTILEEEPEVLTFYGTPVRVVDEFYVHIGVPQAPKNQSKTIVDYRIARSQDISYKLQGATKNSISGISPLSNRKMFLSYHQPSFLYGTDTMTINLGDIERLETKYRKTLKCMLSLPDCTTSAAVYLCIGVLPAAAQRDVEILGLLGQLAMCDQESQNIRTIMEHTLTFYGVNFAGWSGLVRRTSLKYGLPDPLQYMQHPWRADRWRQHCKKIVQDYWEKQLIQVVGTSETLQYVDTETASLSIPMRGWQLAGLCSVQVRQATIVNWMILGVYFTRELLFKMKKVKSEQCFACEANDTENLEHFLLHCPYYQNIREEYLPQLIMLNPHISQILNNEKQLILSILDPISSKLPLTVKDSWSSVKGAYEVSRKFCSDMHRKRDKFYIKLDKDNK